MENSSNQAVYSYPPSLAREMAELIGEWRDEIKPGADQRVRRPDPKLLDKYLQLAERSGVPALLVAYATLGCEWAFRTRSATEDDIEKVLYEMQSGLCKPLHPILTSFQAHILIKALEPSLRKQMKGLRIPVIYGFDTPSSDQFWSLFLSGEKRNPKRAEPKHIVRVKKGRAPLLGPIVAGVVAAALFEIDQPKVARKMGRDLCEILLRREVQKQEFRNWERILCALMTGEENLCAWLAGRARAAYQQSFVYKNDNVSPEPFLTKCRNQPGEVLFWFSNVDVLEKAYSTKWA